MTTLASETKTYFGGSLEEVLPQIREELGADAMIIRQREGIVGGLGGFFGRKCIEVEAQPALVPASPAVPRRAIFDAYDTETPFEPMPLVPMFSEPEPEPDFTRAEETRQAPSFATNGLEAMLAQSSPFASTLTSALAAEPFDTLLATAEPAAGEPVAAPSRIVPAEVTPAKAAPIQAGPPARVQSTLTEELRAVHDELVAAAIPVRLAGEIIAEARYALRPFDPDAPIRELVNRSLTRRIPISRQRKSGRRRIAVIGAPFSGRTLVTASLCAAYSRSGRSVAALSLESAREAMRLGALLDNQEITFEIAGSPDQVTRTCASLGSTEVLVADLPPLVDAVDPGRLTKTLELLEALRPDETHLVLPASVSAGDAQAIVSALLPHRVPTRLIVSHCDDRLASGRVVGLALAHRIPVSFVGVGSTIGRLRPAEPDRLSELVLPGMTVLQ